MTQEELKHLDYIQSAISRLAANQFQIKGWSITVDTALLTFFANSLSKGNGANPYFLLSALLPTLLFWILDSKFLSNERRLRQIYMDVIERKGNIQLFHMPLRQYQGAKFSMHSCMFSYANILVYPIVMGCFFAAFLGCMIFLS